MGKEEVLVKQTLCQVEPNELFKLAPLVSNRLKVRIKIVSRMMPTMQQAMIRLLTEHRDVIT